MPSPKDLFGKKRDPNIRQVGYFKDCFTCKTPVATKLPPESDTNVYCSDECRTIMRRRRRSVKSRKRTARRIAEEELNALQKVFVAMCGVCNHSFLTLGTKIAVCSYECASMSMNVELREVNFYVLFKTIVSDYTYTEIENHTNMVEQVVEEIYIQQRYSSSNRKVFKERTTKEDLRSVKGHEAPENEFDFRCPTPYKKVYRTMDEAENFIDLVHSREAYLIPYLCRCSAIHIGHNYPLSMKPR